MGIIRYFKGAKLARMSNGAYSIIRPLGLVKGGKGLKHHENLLTLTAAGIAAKLMELVQRRGEVIRAALADASGESRPRRPLGR